MKIYQLSLATITKYHRLSSLNNIHLFLIVLGAGKSKIWVLADLDLRKNPPSGLQMAAFSLSPLMVEKKLWYFLVFLKGC